MSDDATSGKVEIESTEQFAIELDKLKEQGKLVSMIERGKKNKSLWIIHWFRREPVIKQATLI